MIGRKVANVRSHIGGKNGKSGWDHKMHGADMTITSIGVHIKTATEVPNFSETLIPWPNVVEVQLLPEEHKEQSEPKRGPGRPKLADTAEAH